MDPRPSPSAPGAPQHGLARRRLLWSMTAGLALGAAAGFLAPWQVAALLGWDGLAIAFLVQVWPRVLRLAGPEVARHATAEDDSRRASELVLVGASVVSLVGVGLVLGEAAEHQGLAHGLITATAVLTVVVSWTAVHTVYALRYAGIYYGDTPGGIDFGEDREPDYRDMAYIAFTVGMTYQVSDTVVTAADLRRAVLAHALLSYLFGTGVVAVMINVVASLFR